MPAVAYAYYVLCLRLSVSVCALVISSNAQCLLTCLIETTIPSQPPIGYRAALQFYKTHDSGEHAVFQLPMPAFSASASKVCPTDPQFKTIVHVAAIATDLEPPASSSLWFLKYFCHCHFTRM